MPISNNSTSVAIADIKVDKEKRQRQGDLDVESLQASIAKRGLLNPVVLTADKVLVAGERRLTACIALGWKKIPARLVSELSPVELQIIELEENIKRKDLEWQDIVKGVGTIHDLYLALDPEWTMSDSAEEVGLTLGTVSMYLRVRAELAEKRILEASTVREAYNILGRRDQRAHGDALEELIGAPATPKAAGPQEPEHLIEVLPSEDLGNGKTTPEVFVKVDRKTGERQIVSEGEAKVIEKKNQASGIFSGIMEASFLKWAPGYTGPKFNFIHCDFPYGVNLFNGPQGKGAEPSAGYSDTPEVYDELIECLCANLDKIMTLSGHIMFWLSADHRTIAETVAKFNRLAPSLEFHRFPLIWHKTDNTGIASDPSHGPRHLYEACLFASRSKRTIVRVKADTYGSGIDKTLHPSTKPEPMLRHFMEMIVDENTSMLDPTCGSGASLRAAESLGAKHTLGLEIDPDFCKAAQGALARSRVLLEASRLAKAKTKAPGPVAP